MRAGNYFISGRYLIMDTGAITHLLSANHRALIVLGGAISFLSLFLPFLEIIGNNSISFVSISGLSVALSDTWLFWIYLILLIGLFYGYFRGYGERYPYLFLVIGGCLFLITLFATREYSGGFAVISLAVGFYLECISSLAVVAGGYYYYLERTGCWPEKDSPALYR